MDDRHDLAGVDLNLLVALDALLEAENVTRAARRIGLSQSALSSALGRLRHLFGDPILVRARGGMSPTPLARRLRAPVRRALDEVTSMLRPVGPFDPRAPHRFRIAVTDYVGLVLLPALAARAGWDPEEADQLVAPGRKEDALLFEGGWLAHGRQGRAGRIIFPMNVRDERYPPRG